ncbi:hypothetical protein Vadar_015651 [Vaccinium darrowii]|uniref:Uncharacterized protein n=1 Tax=Vaccinium darrowii TaxID=229202 RepID=A0ACB7ZJR9_9ERIC|nr:hypothetical protein Vadar_015651 [Vaccinium darrowii]
MGSIDLWDDRIRSRSISSSWRSVILPLSKSVPPLPPPHIPHPIDPNSTLNSVKNGGFFLLSRITVYRLQPLQRHNHGGLWTAWLAKVSETHQRDSLHLLNPLANDRMNYPIEVRVSEVGISVVCDTYALKFKHYIRAPPVDRPSCVSRTVLFPSARGNLVEMLAVVDNYGHLAVMRIEGLKWILNDDTTDRWFDYIFITMARPSFRKKYLVESSGDLLLVDEYTNENLYVIDHDIVTGEVYSREQDAIFQAPIFFKKDAAGIARPDLLWESILRRGIRKDYDLKKKGFYLDFAEARR